jgi:hypothetical protein
LHFEISLKDHFPPTQRSVISLFSEWRQVQRFFLIGGGPPPSTALAAGWLGCRLRGGERRGARELGTEEEEEKEEEEWFL